MIFPWKFFLILERLPNAVLMFACRCFKTCFLFRANHFCCLAQVNLFSFALLFPRIDSLLLFFKENDKRGGASNWTWKGSFTFEWFYLVLKIGNTCTNQFQSHYFLNEILIWLIRWTFLRDCFCGFLRQVFNMIFCFENYWCNLCFEHTFDRHLLNLFHKKIFQHFSTTRCTRSMQCNFKCILIYHANKVLWVQKSRGNYFFFRSKRKRVVHHLKIFNASRKKGLHSFHSRWKITIIPTQPSSWWRKHTKISPWIFLKRLKN